MRRISETISNLVSEFFNMKKKKSCYNKLCTTLVCQNDFADNFCPRFFENDDCVK